LRDSQTEPARIAAVFRVHATYIIVLYVACELIANVTATKITIAGPFTVPAAIYIFALTFTLIDLINEGLGKRAARRVVYAALAANLLLALYSIIAVRLPSPEWFEGAAGFAEVFEKTPRIVIASLTAFLVSGLLDVELFAALRARLNPGWRVVVSNAASTLIDSIIFISIAFWRFFQPEDVIAMIGMLILGQYVIKLIVTAASVPLIYLVRTYIAVDAGDAKQEAA